MYRRGFPAGLWEQNETLRLKNASLKTPAERTHLLTDK
jgi:hypothetical protein